jgi:mono/diheme cytochrome c family protein
VRAALALLLCAALPGCMQEMAVQPSYRPLQASNFFPDGRASRPLVPGTVARGELRADLAFYAGKAVREEETQAAAAVKALRGPFAAFAPDLGDDPFVETIPLKEIDADVLRRGQTNFNIFCAVCHDRAGTGDGMVKRRGFTPPPSFHIDRLRKSRPGYFYQVITQGYGAMPAYAPQIPPRDRWEIVAYVRALQLLSEGTPADKIPADLREALGKTEESKKEGGKKEGGKK